MAIVHEEQILKDFSRLIEELSPLTRESTCVKYHLCVQDKDEKGEEYHSSKFKEQIQRMKSDR